MVQVTFIDLTDTLADPNAPQAAPARPQQRAPITPITLEELIDQGNPLPLKLRPVVRAATEYVQRVINERDDHGDTFTQRLTQARLLPEGDTERGAVVNTIDDRVMDWQKTYRGTLRDHELRWVRARVIDNLLGAGAIEPLRRDPRVTEVLVRAPAPVLTDTPEGPRYGQGTAVEVYGQGLLDAPGVVFGSDTEVLQFVEVLHPEGRQPTLTKPILSGSLPDGTRLEAAHPVVAGGHTFVSLRRHPEEAHTLVDLVEWDSMTPELATDLAAMVRARLNLVVSGGTSSGKALDVDTPIPTPDGFVRMGDLTVGDTVFSETGEPCRVVGAFDTMYDHTCYEVEFSDGSVIVADADHLWLTETRTARRAGFRDTGNRVRQFRGDDATVAATRKACASGAGLVGVNELADAIRQHGGTVGRTFVRSVLAATPSAGEVRVGPRHKPATGWDRREAYAALVSAMCELRNDQRDQQEKAEVRTTEDIRATLRTETGHANHSIPVAGVAQTAARHLPLDPYLLGIWLGDGATSAGRITTADAEVVEAFQAAGFTVNRVKGSDYDYSVLGLKVVLRQVGVLGDKHIPEDYLFASPDQRLALLQGLMDSDGTAAPHAEAQFTNTNGRLASQVRSLVASLGMKASMRVNPSYLDGKRCKDAWTVSFGPQVPVFRLPRKQGVYDDARTRVGRRGNLHLNRYIVDVREVPSRPVRCIMVDSESHLFLAGESFIPTHNTTLLGALMPFLPSDVHLILVEDTQELKEPKHLRLVSRRLTRPADGGSVEDVDIRRQVRSALRSRPDVIIVGEVRGAEAVDALTAMNTGHEGSMLTCHANSAHETVIRLETMMSESGEVSEAAATHKIASSIDVIVFTRRLPDGRRRVTMVAEVIKPPLTDTRRIDHVELRPLWVWDDAAGTQVRVGELSPELLDVRQIPHLPVISWDEVERISGLRRTRADISS